MSGPRKSEQEVWGCACPRWSDAATCIDLRYHGHAPVLDDEGSRVSDEECACACHTHEHEDSDE